MKADMWMPLYIGDYLGDTLGLTHAEHGAYLLAIMAYWKKRSPLTQVELSQVCGDEFECVKRFFRKNGDLYHHKRIDAEILRAERVNEARSQSGKIGAAARWQTHGERMDLPMTNAQQNDAPSQSQSHVQSPSPSQSPAPSPASSKGPPWQAILNWLLDAQKNGADYTEAEAKSAFLALSASGWMWGRNPVGDARAAVERQILTDRRLGKQGNNGKLTITQLKTSLDAKRELRQKIVNRGHESPMGFTPREGDHAEYTRLNREIADLMHRIDKATSCPTAPPKP